MAKPRVLPVPLPNQAAAVLWRGDEGDPALRAQEGEGWRTQTRTWGGRGHSEQTARRGDRGQGSHWARLGSRR